MRTSLSATKTNSRRGSRSGRRIGALFFVALLGFVVLSFMRGGVGGAVAFVVSPITDFKIWFGSSSATIPTFFRTHSSLVSEVTMLRENIEQRAADTFTISWLTKENDLLRRELGLREESRIVAGVLMHPSQTPYDTLLVDKGTRDGVVEGATVYVEGDIAIGSVIRAYESNALVELVSTSGVHSTAFIFGPDIFTDAEGQGGGIVRVSVPQDIPLAVGNLVVLPGASAGVYGAITHIEAPESSPQQFGYVAGPIPLASIRTVHISTARAPTLTYEEARAVVASASTTLFGVPIPDDVLIGTSTPTSTSHQ
jgi:hypothetical protein